MNPFDWLNSINHEKKDLLKEDPKLESQYNAFMVNRGLSYFIDTIMFANEMNTYYDTDKKMQYHFLLHGIPKKKRFAKWAKEEKSEDVDFISSSFQYSKQKSKEVLKTLSETQLQELKSLYVTGGRKAK